MDTVEDRMNEYMLTTVDNPYNPWTRFDEWLAFDMVKGYNTPGFLARVVKTSDALSDADQAQAIQLAIDEIVRENVAGIYRKIAIDSSFPSTLGETQG